MKKALLLFAISTLMSSFSWAQNQYEMSIFRQGTKVFTLPTEQTDSIKVVDGSMLVNYGGTTWNRGTSDIDSITFSLVMSQDTTFADTTAIDTTNSIRINWTPSGVVVTNPYSASGVTITASGDDVNVASTSSTSDLVYVLNGTTSEGSLNITSDKKLILVLENVSITNSDGPAIKMVSDKRVLLHLTEKSSNAFSDGTANTEKGAIQFKGKLDIQGNGALNVSGLAKHGIQSAGKCNVMNGNINITTTAKDGMNVDDFVMDGGHINITSAGDGIDGDKGMVEINNGTIIVNCSSEDAKGICCDSTMTINGGHINVTMAGDMAKCLKAKQDIAIHNGTLDLNANGSVVLEPAGSGYDPSYCTGIKTDGSLTIDGGEININCPASNAGGKGISTDGNVTISNGFITINALGGSASYIDENGATDDYSSTCISSDSDITINGGLLTLNAGGKAIKADGNYTQNGGELTLTTIGDGAVTVGSGTSASDGYSSACVKADGSITILGGKLDGKSTGRGGRGLVAAHFVVGAIDADNDLIDINIQTSGSPVNASGNGGWGGPGGGQGSSDYWKGLPKGIKMDSSIVINSGHVSVYCSQTSGDPNGEAIESKGTIVINGGEIEANSYDDAINAAQAITINGGKIWAYARGNDAIDCNGTSVTINDGLVIVQGSEVGIDADTENGGRFNIVGGTIISKGGNMGCWDTPTCTGSQRYITATVTPANGFAIADQNDNILLVFKAPTVSGSGFIDQTNGTGTKPPPGGGGNNGGVGISLPGMTQGSYKVYTNVAISNGSQWHGYYTGADCTTSGNATTVNTR